MAVDGVNAAATTTVKEKPPVQTKTATAGVEELKTDVKKAIEEGKMDPKAIQTATPKETQAKKVDIKA